MFLAVVNIKFNEQPFLEKKVAKTIPNNFILGISDV